MVKIWYLPISSTAALDSFHRYLKGGSKWGSVFNAEVRSLWARLLLLYLGCLCLRNGHTYRYSELRNKSLQLLPFLSASDLSHLREDSVDTSSAHYDDFWLVNWDEPLNLSRTWYWETTKKTFARHLATNLTEWKLSWGLSFFPFDATSFVVGGGLSTFFLTNWTRLSQSKILRSPDLAWWGLAVKLCLSIRTTDVCLGTLWTLLQNTPLAVISTLLCLSSALFYFPCNNNILTSILLFGLCHCL